MAVIISCAWPVVAWLIARAIVQQASFKVIERAPRVVMVDDHSEDFRVRNRDFDGARQISIWRSHRVPVPPPNWIRKSQACLTGAGAHFRILSCAGFCSRSAARQRQLW